MENIFINEEEVLRRSEQLLASEAFKSSADAGHYRRLLNEYRTLLSQMRRMVRMSDRMEGNLNEMSHRLAKLAKVDFLTNLYNRRYFNEALQKEWQCGIRSGKTLALILIDVDHFKKFNDLYGHLEGDNCLETVASSILSAARRPRDVAARYGGEEFAVLLPETELCGAGHVARSIQSSVALLDIPHGGAQGKGKITVSIGYAAILPMSDLPSSALVVNADKALYRAKDEGRDRVIEG